MNISTEELTAMVEAAFREGWQRKAMEPDYANYDIDEDWTYSSAKEAVDTYAAGSNNCANAADTDPKPLA